MLLMNRGHSSILCWVSAVVLALSAVSLLTAGFPYGGQNDNDLSAYSADFSDAGYDVSDSSSSNAAASSTFPGDSAEYIDALWDDNLVTPKVRIQAWLGEGLGWEGLDTQTAIHVVVSVEGESDSLPSGAFIPYRGRTVHIASSLPVQAQYESGDGSGKSKTITLSSRVGFKASANDFGRVSFSIPIDNILGRKGKVTFPTIFVKTDDSPEWVGALIDSDLIHKLASITAADLMSISPNGDAKQAENYARVIRHIAGATKSHVAYSVDGEGELSRLQPISHFAKRHRSEKHYAEYDETKNYLPCFRVKKSPQGEFNRIHRVLPSLSSARSYSKRSEPVEHSAWSRSVFAKRGLKEESHELIVSDEHAKVMLIKKGNAFETLFEGMDKIGSFVVHSIEAVWEVVTFITKKLLDFTGLAKLLRNLQGLFHWRDILRTNEYLNVYYKKLAPLGLRGLDILRSRYRTLFSNLTYKAEHLFAKSIDSLGGEDMTLNALHADMKKAALRASFDTGVNVGSSDNSTFAALSNPSSSDARTSMIQDRYLNNLHHARMDDLTVELAHRMSDIMKGFADALLSVIDKDVINSIMPHVLKFQAGAKFHEKALAEFLNFFRSIVVVSEQVSFRVLDAIIHLLPAYWNLALTFMTFPIEIPFFTGLWKHKLTQDTDADMSVLNALTIMGSTFATSTYKLYNHQKAPFNANDIIALKTVKEPELFLYTWNQHALTFTADAAEQKHRLGLYDWIPRAHSAILAVVQKLTFDIPFIKLAEGSPDITKPNGYTKPAQILGTIANIMGRMGGYPFTQLSTTDPAVIDFSKSHPDSRFLGWWTFWIVEDIVRVVRPRMGPLFAVGPFYTISNLVIVGVPLSIYGMRVNWDTGKGIEKTDYPRRAIVASMWLENLSYYFEISLPYIPLTKVPMPTKVVSLMTRDAIFLSNFIIRAHLMFAYEIVGMLSSNYQGGEKKE